MPETQCRSDETNRTATKQNKKNKSLETAQPGRQYQAKNGIEVVGKCFAIEVNVAIPPYPCLHSSRPPVDLRVCRNTFDEHGSEERTRGVGNSSNALACHCHRW